MGKTYKSAVVVEGNADGAVKAVNKTTSELEGLSNTQEKNKKVTKEGNSAWEEATQKAANWAAGLYSVSQAWGFLTGKIEGARAVENLSRVANANTEQFQLWAAGARTVGIEQDKLADILKDVGDKAGDFMSTGGGAMKDFFENIAPQVGVTAEQFRNLSGPDALQLYVSSLEKANLSQSEMTFYMEAVAGDATALLPLLQDNGAAMGEMGSQAQALGAVMDAEMLAVLGKVNADLDVMKMASTGVGNTILKEMLPTISTASDLMVEFATNTDGVGVAAKVADGFLKAMITTGVIIAATFETVGNRIGAVAAALVAAAKGDFKGAWGIIQESNADALSSVEATMARIKKLWTEDAVDWSEILIDTTRRQATVFGQSGQEIQDALKQQEEALKSAGKELDKYFAKEEKLSLERSEIFSDLNFQIDALTREAAIIGQGTSAKEALNRQLAIENALRSDAGKRLLPHQIEGYKQLVGQIYDLQLGTEKANALAEETVRVWQEATDRINEVASDGWTRTWESLFEGTKVKFSDLADTLKEGFYRLLGELSHMAFTRPILLSIGGGGSVNANAGGVGAGSSGSFDFSSITNMFSNGLGSLGGTALQGINWLNKIPGLGQFASTAGMNMVSAGDSIGGLFGFDNMSASTSAGVGMIANAIAGYAGSWVGTTLGESLFGKQAESAWGATAGSVIGSIWGPWGAAIGGAIGGAIDAATGGDGKKRAALGVSTNADWNNVDTIQAASGLALTAYSKRAGDEGWEAAKQMQQLLLANDAALTGFFRSLGETVDLAGQTLEGKASQFGSAVDGFFGASGFNGLDPAELLGAPDEFVASWMARFNEVNKTAYDLGPIIALRGENELLADVLVRVYTQVGPVNAILEALGHSVYDVSIAGMAAADGLVSAAGGLQNLAALADYYYQNVYTEEERRGHLVEQYSQTLAAFNDTYGTAIASTDDLRSYVDALANSEGFATEATQAAYVAALALTPSLVGLRDALGAVGDTVEDVVEQVLSAGQLSTLADIGGTILAGYQDREATLADLNDRLIDINAEIADMTTGVADSIAEVPDTLGQIADSVDTLRFSSSQLRSVADGIRSTIASLSLGATTYLTNREQLDFAQSQFEAAQQAYARDGDASGIASAASTYLQEVAQYFAGGAQGRAIFDDVLSYLNTVGVTLDAQASAAEVAERQRAAQQAALNSIESIATRTLTDQQSNARLDQLLQERQTLELQIANLTALDSKGILESQLQALIDSTAGIDTMAGLLANLPGEIAAGLAGVIGEAIASYGGTLNADGSNNVVDRLFAQVLGRMPTVTEDSYWEAFASNSSLSALVGAFYNQMITGAGVSAGMTQEQFLSGYNVPQFAGGGDHGGGWRVVGEQGPELEYTGPSHIVSNAGSRALFDDSRIVRELSALREENKDLRTAVERLERTSAGAATKSSQQQKEQVDAVKQLPAAIAKAVNPVKV